jgi:hypothetical protein
VATSMAIAEALAQPSPAPVSAANPAPPAASLPSTAGPRAPAADLLRRDPRRAWIWWFLTILVASQMYFVRELAAAFLLFAIGFAAIAAVVAGLYLLTKVWALAVDRLAELRHPAMNLAALPSEERKAA